MATISITNEWRYEAGLSKSIGNDSTHSYFNGAGYNGNYHVAVYKCYTDKTIASPKIKLRGISDDTNASKYLGVYFVSCSSDDNPSSTLTANSNALSGKYQTRIRFGFDFTGSFSDGSWSSNSSVYGSGTCQSSVVIPAGYFFVYVGTGTGSSYTNWSTFGASTNTKSGYAPQITGTDAKYTISYNANGGSGSTASQSVTAGESVKLQANGFTPPTTAVHGITLKDSDGTTLSSATYSTFKNNAFYRWLIGSKYYAAGDNYTPTANVTAKAYWSTNYTLKKVTKNPTTATGFTITYDPNGGACSITSETMTNTTTYEHTKWVSGTSEYGPTATLGGPAAYTFTVKYTPTTTNGSTTLPTPTNKTTSTLKITFDYQGGSGSPTSANSTKTIAKAFKGWATSSTATSGFTGSYTPDKSRTLYAIWGTSTTKYSAINLPTPTKTGYKFMGWATSASATEGSFGSYTPASDSVTTLYAIWEANGNIRIYVNSTDKYKMAIVYVYAPTSTSDTKPWKLVIPYLYTSGTQPWKIIAG